MNKIEIDKLQLEELLKQNLEMREIITKSYSTFEFMLKILGITNLDDFSTFNLTLKLPKIINQIKSNQEAFSEVTKPEFLQKLKNYANTDQQ
jgi:hypothetical protein